MHPGGNGRQAGTAALIKGALAVEILRAMNRSVDDTILEDEARRIEQATSAPDTIAAVKAVFGRDTKKYLNQVVRPTYAERILSGDVFPNAKEIQRERSLQSIALLNDALKAPDAFHAAAKRYGAAFARLHVAARKGTITALEGSDRLSPGPAEMIIRYAYSLRPGEVCPAIINDNGVYFVMRFVKRDGKDYIVESASIPRKTYEEWFWERAGAIPIKVKSQAFAEELRAAPWATHLKL